MTGPKIDIDAVAGAIKKVEDAQQQMESLTTSILASTGMSLEAIKAPAGQITAQTFDDLGGGGKALAEELARLKHDLGTLIKVAQSGSEDASSAAKSGAVGAGTSVASGM